MILRGYGMFGAIRLLINLLLTKIFFRASRLIRFPIYIRGRKFMNLGMGLTTGVNVRLEAFPVEERCVLHFGDHIQLNDSIHIAAIECVEIGDYALIASRVFITDHNHGGYSSPINGCAPDIPPIQRPLVSSPVKIGRNVWIGEQVCILPGVTIGDGAIIGACSVVTRNIPAHSIATGNPARIIRAFDWKIGEWKRI